MKRLPKGLKKVSKSDFVMQLSISAKEKGIKLEKDEEKYIEWSKVVENNPHRQTHRW